MYLVCSVVFASVYSSIIRNTNERQFLNPIMSTLERLVLALRKLWAPTIRNKSVFVDSTGDIIFM